MHDDFDITIECEDEKLHNKKKSKSVVKFGPTATEKKLDQQIMNLVSWNNITKREQKTEYIQTRIQEH